MKVLPLNALRVFRVVADSGGIRPAARQLNVSPSAVHRHVRELEAQIGNVLVETVDGRLRLSETGIMLASEIATGFEHLISGMEKAQEDRGVHSVMIATSESFASRWLLPRLAKFRKAHPRIELSLVTSRRAADIPRRAHLAIRMGAGSWPGQNSMPLMPEWIVPVMSPQLLENCSLDHVPESLLDYPLLHDRDPQATWRAWLKDQGFNTSQFGGGSRFTSTNLVLDAAQKGFGIAIARIQLAASSIADGKLIIPCPDHAVSIGMSYWLIAPKTPRKVEQIFINWLVEETSACAEINNAVGIRISN